MKKVKCIEGNPYAAPPLVVGEIYEVIREENNGVYNDCYFLNRGSAGEDGWFKYRFIVVEDDASTTKSQSHECPCGIVRAQCDYHKV